MSEKTIIFYSGKLWYSDKPFPVNEPITHAAPAGSSGVAKVMHSLKIEHWLSTAYEVVNPEVILTQDMCDAYGKSVDPGRPFIISVKQCIQSKVLPFNDGDQIPLPEGLTVEVIEQYLASNGNWIDPKEPHHFDPVYNHRKVARLIKEPVKNVLVTDDGSCEAAIKIAKRLAEENIVHLNTEEAEPERNIGYHLVRDPSGNEFKAYWNGHGFIDFDTTNWVYHENVIPVSEPSESQEELWNALIDEWNAASLNLSSERLFEYLRSKFTITRK